MTNLVFKYIGTILRRNETENRAGLYFFSGFSRALLKIDMKLIERKKKPVD